MKTEDGNKTEFKLRLASGFTTLLLIVAIVCCLFFTLQSLSKGYVSFGGTSIFRVVTGSMEPQIPVGALLVSQKEDIEKISVDDIVCFRSKEAGTRSIIITHRVVGIFTAPNGKPLLQTKGDANLSVDAEYVSEKNLIGRVTWHSGVGSKVATIISFLTSDFGFLACIILPVILIAIIVFRNAIKSVKNAIIVAQKQLEEQNSQSKIKAEISKEEYEEMYLRIAKEVREELEQDAEKSVEQDEKNAFESCDTVEANATASTDEET